MYVDTKWLKRCDADVDAEVELVPKTKQRIIDIPLNNNVISFGELRRLSHYENSSAS